jgi:hypothetical protein
MSDGKDKSHPNLIGPHGGYRQLKSYQNWEIVYDATVAFCDRFVRGLKGTGWFFFAASAMRGKI